MSTSTQTAQILKDKIVCCENEIKQIDEKLNLIMFISGVNNAFVPESLLKTDELKEEKTSLQKRLKALKASF